MLHVQMRHDSHPPSTHTHTQKKKKEKKKKKKEEEDEEEEERKKKKIIQLNPTPLEERKSQLLLC